MNDAIETSCALLIQLSGRHPTSEHSNGNIQIGIHLERVSVLFDMKHIDKLKLRHGGCDRSFKAADKEHSLALGIETRQGGRRQDEEARGTVLALRYRPVEQYRISVFLTIFLILISIL